MNLTRLDASSRILEFYKLEPTDFQRNHHQADRTDRYSGSCQKPETTSQIRDPVTGRFKKTQPRSTSCTKESSQAPIDSTTCESSYESYQAPIPAEIRPTILDLTAGASVQQTIQNKPIAASLEERPSAERRDCIGRIGWGNEEI